MLISRGGKGVASSRSASSSANCSGDLMLRLYFCMATSQSKSTTPPRQRCWMSARIGFLSFNLSSRKPARIIWPILTSRSPGGGVSTAGMFSNARKPLRAGISARAAMAPPPNRRKSRREQELTVWSIMPSPCQACNQVQRTRPERRGRDALHPATQSPVTLTPPMGHTPPSNTIQLPGWSSNERRNYPVAQLSQAHQYPFSQYVSSSASIRFVVSSCDFGSGYFGSAIGPYTFWNGPHV